MQEEHQHNNEIQLFNYLYFTNKLKEVLQVVAQWSQIIGVISMINAGISAIQLFTNSNNEDIAIKALSAVVGFLLFKSGVNIEKGLANYNQTTLQNGFRYLYRYFFVSFILYTFLAIILIIVGFTYFI
jgi:hypothetical protein